MSLNGPYQLVPRLFRGSRPIDSCSRCNLRLSGCLICARLTQFELALADFTRAIEIDPKDEDAYRERGNVYLLKGELGKAIEDFNKIIDINPGSVFGHYNRGIALLRKGESERAIAAFTAAINISPDFGHAYGNRGAAYAHKGPT